jgi:hypothetical protein
MLLPFIKNVLAQREEPMTFDRRLEPIGQLGANIRKQINLIKQESIWFSNNVEAQYNSLMVDKNDYKSTQTVLIEIQIFISDGLKQ